MSEDNRLRQIGDAMNKATSLDDITTVAEDFITTKVDFTNFASLTNRQFMSSFDVAQAGMIAKKYAAIRFEQGIPVGDAYVEFLEKYAGRDERFIYGTAMVAPLVDREYGREAVEKIFAYLQDKAPESE